jgi:hypothetical protein
MPYGFTQTDWDAAKDQARDAMIGRASLRGMIAYSDLTAAITAIRLAPDSSALAALLGEISTDENAAGRGMLSVIVVHKVGDMEPGKGFYKLAAKLGKDTGNQLAFWIDELHRVHAEWSR